uniref:Phage regulatory protein, rha family n=1 Tax=Candidatus Kentrum sp. LFY TaxID=2126342 RepID=A0A450WGM7_9GAMM|nr:MAG: phage regulatory protein, rha family [Candidatus Kentron sp. LFY]
MNEITKNNDMSLVHRNGARLFTTSRDIARRFGKRHHHVLRDIENLECSEEFRLSNFGETVHRRPNPSGGRPIPAKMYEITRDGFAILAMGFTGRRAMEWKERYIAAFNAMEQELRERHDARLVLENTENMRLALRSQEELLHAYRRETTRLNHLLDNAHHEKQCILWAFGPMHEEEYEKVRAYRKIGYTWTRIAREVSYRSAKSLSRQFRGYRDGHSAGSPGPRWRGRAAGTTSTRNDAFPRGNEERPHRTGGTP